VKYQIPLALSLSLNVILIGAFVVAPEREPAPGHPSPDESRSFLKPPREASGAAHVSESAAQVSPRRKSTGLAWEQSLQQLRDAGVPRDVMAGLVIADFDIRWQKQLREFEQRYQAGAVDDDERARFQARRDDEQENSLRAALGDEDFRQWDQDYNLRDLDLALRLSSSERDAVYRLRKDRARKDRLLSEALRNGEIDEADYNEQQSAAQREYDQQFKMLLGDERYEALQNSEEGMEGAMRQKLKSLSTPDSQVPVMVDAERKWNQRRAELERLAQETPDQRKAYEEQLRALDVARDQEHERLLGSNDFDQLQKNQDGRYQLLKRHANTWALSDTDIDYIYSSVRNYQDMNPQARGQVEQSLMSYLGPERFERLKSNDLFKLGEQKTDYASF